ncbi:MAG: FGGY-family carbohydrate kinase, partial [Gemmatimonadaceae bacterium]
GWNLNHNASDELFAAIEGTAFHTRIVLERMADHGVPINRVIHGGGIAQKNDLLNQVYANVLGKPILVPERPITGLGSSIFAFLAAGVFDTVEDAQRALCPPFRVIVPDPREQATYERLYEIYRSLYFAMGDPSSPAIHMGNVLPDLRAIAAQARSAAPSA